MPQRKPQLFALIGTNGSGKTTLTINKFIKPFMKTRKILIVQEFDNEDKLNDYPLIDIRDKDAMDQWEQKNGVRRINAVDFEDEKVYLHIRSFVHNAIILLDDAGNYTPRNLQMHDIHKFFRNRRQWMFDVVTTWHSFGDIPKALFKFGPKLIIGKTVPTDYQSIKAALGPSRGERLWKIVDHINTLNNETEYTFKSVDLNSI